ncbi:kinase [Streptomyces sp. NPDC051561]|uniref:GHMP family kinase ATP-binding protein n=1 Tax=Streptomyces sp. NPDC051561 TaxID=3365658 RepID=UPI0037A72D64
MDDTRTPPGPQGAPGSSGLPGTSGTPVPPGPAADESTWGIGSASSPVHHGEIVQGAFPVGEGIKRGLVTLPSTLYTSRARFTPDATGVVTVTPQSCEKSRRAAELTTRHLSGPLGRPLGGHLDIASDVPLCRGFGSSTSDVLATIRAVQDAFRTPLPPDETAMLAVRAETASDSLMYDQSAVLFAHREGVLIEDFGSALPPARVLGFGTARGGAGGVDTLGYRPARYTGPELETFGELRHMLRIAVADKDVALMGAVATRSTEINQRHLPIPQWDEVTAILRATGATGLQTAHSGDIAGFLFDRDDPEVEARTDRARTMLRAVGFNEQWGFSTGE